MMPTDESTAAWPGMAAKDGSFLHGEQTMTHIRWMIRRDFPEVIDIENRCFEHPMTEEDFVTALRQRRTVAMVIDDDDGYAIGYMVYDLYHTKIQVTNFAVDPDNQRLGVGTVMIDKLHSKLSAERRNRLVLAVRETNLPAQLFFRAYGFKAIEVLRDFYDEMDEAAYLMEFRYQEKRPVKIINRLSRAFE